MTGPRATSRIERLTPSGIITAKQGDHLDGGGLQLNKRQHRASWVFRFVSPCGTRRAIGFGAARLEREDTAYASLIAARAAAVASREMLLCGIDPWEQREQLRLLVKEKRAGQMAQKLLTLGQAVRNFHARVIKPSRDAIYARTWISMIERHVPANLLNKPLNEISGPMLLRALAGIRASRSGAYLPAGATIPMTARRVRASLERVFDDALFYGRCTFNPAALVTRKLGESDARPIRGHYASLPYPLAPALYTRLTEVGGTVARCLEFSLLTASRKIETTRATWGEFKLQEGIWNVPAERMKSRKDHVVFLTARAVEIVRGQRGLDAVYVFPSIYGKIGSPRHITEHPMRHLLVKLDPQKRTTVHGLCRATFSTWAYELSNERSDVIEACLAHRELDRAKAAYNRAEFLESRRALLRDWNQYLSPTMETNVIPFERTSQEAVRLISSRPAVSPPPLYLRLRDVMRSVDLCQSSIYAQVRTNRFPKPIKFGMMNGWLEEDILAWICRQKLTKNLLKS